MGKRTRSAIPPPMLTKGLMARQCESCEASPATKDGCSPTTALVTCAFKSCESPQKPSTPRSRSFGMRMDRSVTSSIGSEGLEVDGRLIEDGLKCRFSDTGNTWTYRKYRALSVAWLEVSENDITSAKNSNTDWSS